VWRVRHDISQLYGMSYISFSMYHRVQDKSVPGAKMRVLTETTVVFQLLQLFFELIEIVLIRITNRSVLNRIIEAIVPAQCICKN